METLKLLFVKWQVGQLFRTIFVVKFTLCFYSVFKKLQTSTFITHQAHVFGHYLVRKWVKWVSTHERLQLWCCHTSKFALSPKAHYELYGDWHYSSYRNYGEWQYSSYQNISTFVRLYTWSLNYVLLRNI